MKYLFIVLLNFVTLIISIKHLNENGFDDLVENLADKVCPFVDYENSKGSCPIQNDDYDQIRFKNKKLRIELLTFDVISNQIRMPIIDLKESKNVIYSNFTENKTICSPKILYSIDDFYETFLKIKEKPHIMNNGIFYKDTYEDFLQILYKERIGNLLFIANRKIFNNFQIEIKSLSDIKLYPDFIKIIKKYLPLEYSYDDYFQFTKIFGTHFSTKTKFGGIIEKQIFMNKCKLQTNKNLKEHLNENLCIDINNPITRNGSEDYIKETTIFKNNIIGGNPLFDLESEIEKRIESFSSLPVGIEMKLVPIYELINDVKKKENLELFFKEYSEFEIEKRTKMIESIKKSQTIPILIGLPKLEKTVNFQYSNILHLNPYEKKASKLYTFKYLYQGKKKVYKRSTTFNCTCKINNNEEIICGCFVYFPSYNITQYCKRILNGTEVNEFNVKYVENGISLSGCFYRFCVPKQSDKHQFECNPLVPAYSFINCEKIEEDLTLKEKMKCVCQY